MQQIQFVAAITEKPEDEEYSRRVDETTQSPVSKHGPSPKGTHVVGAHGTTEGTVSPMDEKRTDPPKAKGATPL